MCGIAGFFNQERASEKTIAALKIMKNRGIDGCGITNNKKRNIADSPSELKPLDGRNSMGHCLHAMVGDNVMQPMIAEDTSIVANCEIYNWKSLKTKARNDAEALFFLLEKDDINAQEPLKGVYAFAFWKGDRLILARDIIGEKPLWYSTENGFSFASEKKALERQGIKNIVELNPRNLLAYDIKENKVSFTERKFFDTEPEIKGSEEEIAEKVLKLVEKSVKERLPNRKIGLLFSSGLDSLVIAKILKDLKADFTCYVAGLEDSQDVVEAEKTAKALGLPLKKVILDEKKIRKLLPKVVPLIEDNNVVKVGVAITIYAACEKMRIDDISVCFSGSGADELFAGYERHKHSAYLNKECLSSMRKIYEVNCYRDDVVTMNNSIELRTPYLDVELVKYALKIPAALKIKGDVNKYVLRKAAEKMGLSEFSGRKKKAAQYGSKVDSVIEKFAKREKKSKSEYLRQFFDPGNVKLGVLFSSGKDSVYAAETMMKQNYDIRCLITLKSSNPDSFMFHTPNVNLASLAAEAMELPIVIQETKGVKEKELEDMKKAIERAKTEYGIEGIVTGALYSNYQRNRIEAVCDSLNLKCFSPLWHADQEQHMRRLLNEGYEIMLSSIAAYGLDKSWLGRKITMKDVDKLVALNKKYGVNVAGEGGEFESLVLFAPKMFKKRIKVTDFEIKEEDESTAKMLVKSAALE